MGEEAGELVAGRLVPVGSELEFGGGGLTFVFPLATATGTLTFSAVVSCCLDGAATATDFASSLGEGGGGGMSVPSVSEPNLKSKAGSSKRFFEPEIAGMVVVLFVLAGIACGVGPRYRVGWTQLFQELVVCELRLRKKELYDKDDPNENDSRKASGRKSS